MIPHQIMEERLLINHYQTRDVNADCFQSHYKKISFKISLFKLNNFMINTHFVMKKGSARYFVSL